MCLLALFQNQPQPQPPTYRMHQTVWWTTLAAIAPAPLITRSEPSGASRLQPPLRRADSLPPGLGIVVNRGDVLSFSHQYDPFFFL